MASSQHEFGRFLALSAAITGFSEYRLRGTGEAEEFFDSLGRILGAPLFAEFLAAGHAALVAAGEDEAREEPILRAQLFSDQKFGPIARNLIKLWYVGTWYRLPMSWHDQFRAAADDADRIFSTAAYTEALLWPAIGANPPGAKGPGYATWAEPPLIPEF